MNIAVGSDHAGLALKEEIIRFLESERMHYKDFGVFSPEPMDYPDVGVQVAEAVANGEFDRGILVCGSGIGMSITANKVSGIRAALCGDVLCARLSREHNDSNILVLGERTTEISTALEIVKTWLATEFPNEDRHVRRIRKIADIDERHRGGRYG